MLVRLMVVLLIFRCCWVTCRGSRCSGSLGTFCTLLSLVDSAVLLGSVGRIKVPDLPLSSILHCINSLFYLLRNQVTLDWGF